MNRLALLGLILYMEKISYDKAEEMGRLLISSIDAKDEYQATHSLNVRTMIDIFIDELSRDKDLRERIESIGFKLTVDRIERLRLAALLHDMGKIFVPGKILRKSDLTKEEILIRKMHSYCTYNILNKSKTLGNVADIASMHHALYYIPLETDVLDDYTKIETNFISYPFDRLAQSTFSPESQIISLADVLNAIIRDRPGGKGLSLSDALNIIKNEEYKFHEGLKEIFLTIVRRVEKNIIQGKYLPQQTEEYRCCLWLEKPDQQKKKNIGQLNDLDRFLKQINLNYMGIVGLMNWKDGKFLLDKKIKIKNKNVNITKIQDKHILLSIRNIPTVEGFIWIDNIMEYLTNQSFNGKMAFAFFGNSGCSASIEDIYNSLANGLRKVKNEPVHYFLNPDLYKCK